MYERMRPEDEAYIQAVKEYVLKYQNDNPEKMSGYTKKDFDVKPRLITWNGSTLDIVASIMYNDMLSEYFEKMEASGYATRYARQYKHTSNALKVAMYEKRLK